MRVMLAGTSSGCGKTTVTLALLHKLRMAGLMPAPFKSGPDYIDPGFHALAAQRPSHNLDLFLMDEAAISDVLALGMRGAGIGIVEGAMSFYDGIGPEGHCSAHALSLQTQTPVLLVVDASGSATGVAATVLGFQTYKTPNTIAGVLVNGVSGDAHYALVKAAVEQRTGLPCVGCMRKSEAIQLSSRHLGLIPAEEVEDIRARISAAADLLTVDIDALLRIASAAPSCTEVRMEPSLKKHVRIGVARDAAFSFYYEANLEMLRRMGAELVFFSPLNDAALPANLNALYLGGGFPEVFAERFAQNSSMRQSLKTALEEGLPCYAECGGMMALTRAIDGHEAVGFFDFSCVMTKRLQRFGYVSVTDKKTGMTFPAHEFHHSLEQGDEAYPHQFDIVRAGNAQSRWTGAYRKKNTLAGYPHLHFWGKSALANMLFGGIFA